MKRTLLILAAILLAGPPVRGQTPEITTLTYLNLRQTKEGGFVASKNDTKATLGPTSAAIRALKYFGGEVADRDACIKFVSSCFDKETGGFRPRPDEGKPDVFTTAVGIMAVVALKMPLKDYEAPVMAYLGKNAKSFEEIRIAAAGLESLGKLPPQSADWLKTLAGMRNEDGTYGKEDKARATGGAVACQLRLGEKVKDPKAILALLKSSQQADGGFHKEGAKTSDLETTYRITRTFVMLGDRPAAGKLKEFIEKCRNDDGGYGVTPGAPSSVSGTYYASILRHWLERKK
jgi:prenyltransferase beta subunit